jgi:hypothetical protein
MATKSKSSATKKKTNSNTGRSKPASKTASKRTGTTRSRSLSQSTTDHDEIRRWVEERGGVPACVRGTGDPGDVGMIRIDFPDGPEPALQEISWDEWFEKFDQNNLALLYQQKTAGGQSSRFNKLVKREGQPKTHKAGR